MVLGIMDPTQASFILGNGARVFDQIVTMVSHWIHSKNLRKTTYKKQLIRWPSMLPTMVFLC